MQIYFIFKLRYLSPFLVPRVIIPFLDLVEFLLLLYPAQWVFEKHCVNIACGYFQTPSPYDEYKPYPVQAKIDPSDPLYHEYEKEMEYNQLKAAAQKSDDDPSTCDAKKATQFGK